MIMLVKRLLSCKQNSLRRANIVLLAVRQQFSAPKLSVNLMQRSTTCKLRLQSLEFHCRPLAAILALKTCRRQQQALFQGLVLLRQPSKRTSLIVPKFNTTVASRES